MTTLSRRDVIQIAVAAAAAPLLKAHAQSPAAGRTPLGPVVSERVPEKFRSLPFESQTLGGLFADRMHTNVEGRLLHIDQAAFLSGFLKRDDDAGSFVGEHAGKFLDAACNAVRYRENADLRRIMDKVAKTLIDSQEPDGYLGTYPSGKRWIDWDVWVHKYNLIGLLSYYELTGDTTALTACRKMGDLLDRTFGEAAGKLNIASGVHVGMASTSVLEPMCKLYRFTGERHYLEFCLYIVRAYDQPQGPKIVRALLDHGSVYRTANGKAYEMLSNLVGIIDLYRVTADERLLNAVLRAWDDIVRHQLYPTGTTSAFEHFQPPGQRLSLQASDVGEMCVTVTWLQLNWRLLRLTGEARFGREIERSVYNQLLAAQSARTGKISYFTSYCGCKEHVDAVLCCVSSGPRGISLIPRLVWGLENEAFAIHLFSSGRAHFEMNQIPIEVVSETRFPAEGNVAFEIKPERPVRFAVRLRVPEWVTHFEAKTNSRTFRGSAGQMLDITQTWTSASRIDIRMDLPTKVLPGAPQYADAVALQRGPQILALEKVVNPAIPYLSRVGLSASSGVPTLKPVEVSTPWTGEQLYDIEGVTAMNAIPGALDPCVLRVVPFADALNYRVWIARGDRLRRDIPALTLGARAGLSEVNMRLEPTDKQQVPWTDIAEYLTDENPKTFCTANPGKPGEMAQYYGRGPAGNREDPVWFSVMLDAPGTISRVVYRHGQIGQKGGWFDSSKGKPRIEVVRKAPPLIEEGSFMVDYDKVQWETLADLDSYPQTDASTPPKLTDGEAFELRVTQPLTIYALRIVGHAGGDYASCAELSAYT